MSEITMKDIYLDMDILELDQQFINIKEDKLKSKQTEINKITSKYNINLESELRSKGYALKSKAIAHSPSTKHTNPAQYKTRMEVLLHLINNPMIAREPKPLQYIWKQLRINIEYGKWVNQMKLGKIDKKVLRNELKAKNIQKTGRLIIVSDLLRIIKTHANKLYLESIEKNLLKSSKHTVIKDSNDSIWYRGLELKKNSRQYKIDIPNHGSLVLRHGVIDKFIELLTKLDNIIDNNE